MGRMYFILIVGLIAGCAADNGNSPIPTNVPNFPENPPSSPAQSQPSGSSSSGNSPSSQTYPTTTGGYFKFSATTTMTLTNSQVLEGFATDSQNKYLLVYENDGGGIYRWYVFSKSLTDFTNPNYVTACSFLDDGKFIGSLQVDSQYFYILGVSASKNTASNYDLRRFSIATCAETRALPTSETNSGSSYYMYFEPGNLWLDQNSLFTIWSSSNVSLVNVTTGTLSSFPSLQQTIGTSTLNYSAAFTGNSAGLWVIDGGSENLWKFTPSGSALGWGELPALQYPGLYNVQFVASPSSTSLVIVSNSSFSGDSIDWGGTVTQYFTDISNY